MTLTDDSAPVDVRRLAINDMVVQRLDSVGPLLDVSHDLLLRVFDPAVVDRKEVYIAALTEDLGRRRDFRPIFVTGIFRDTPNDLLAGFVSAELMWVGNPPAKLQLVVGNIATAPSLRAAGFRGVGSTLWRAVLRYAHEEARKINRGVDYSTAEAESASLLFWAKLGYRWPEGVKYFQPPLEFDDRGDPVYEEVPETLLLHLLNGKANAIDAQELRDIVHSIYWNWCVRPSESKLGDAAMTRATQYVMQRVFTRTAATIAEHGSIRLVDVPLPT